MLTRLYLLSALCLSALTMTAQECDNDFGTWLELGAKKDLGLSPFSLGLDGELRTDDGSSRMDRLSVGLSGTYKLNKYLKFTLGYAFLESYKAEKTKIKEGDVDNKGTVLDFRKRVTESYWMPRHRFYLDISPDIKVGRIVRLSARERYQYTFTPVKHFTRDTYYYYWENGAYVLDEDEDNILGEQRTEVSEHRHVLRSRLKAEIDKKRLRWSPYYSIEFHNNLRAGMNLDKVRNAFGTDYKINRHHSVGAAYILTLDRREAPKELFHALNVSYNYKF